ncbi:MAG: phospho-N-acetylmuramoyl-pentapeptide-transferase [Anaerolineae bacterium]|nr:phospho-N-acetylmuramoyl-pentapeptide-transferase [Anaerolineae bacterium]
MGISLLMGGLAFLLAVAMGKPVIEQLKKYRIGKQIRIDGPSSHMTKTGTPTMGGLVFLIPVLLMIGGMYSYTRVGARVLPGWRDQFGDLVLIGRSLIIPLSVMVAFAILGAVDDYMGVRGVRRGEGMRGRSKALIQLVVAVVAALLMNLVAGYSRVGIPGISEPLELGILWVPIAIFIIHGFANAINLTDGLDGLAALISFLCFTAYGVISYLQEQFFVTMFCMVLAGSLLGFLWFNVHPASMFMGDLGSEALGATLGVVALMTGQWLLLPIIAVIPVAETICVILQVAYFKYTKRKFGEGKRLFKMSPLHNHFVLLGWSEPQIVQRFWLIGILAAMVGVGLAVFGN